MCHDLSADAAARSALVVNDHWLGPLLRQAIGDETSQNIRARPGRIRTMIVIGRVDCACAAERAQKHPTSVVPSAAPKAPTMRPDFSRCRTASLRQRLLEPDGI